MIQSTHWLRVQPSRCSYQYSIVHADQVVAAGRFASHYSRTHGRLPLSLVRDFGWCLWFIFVGKIGTARIHGQTDWTDLSNYGLPTAFDPCNT
jgi:hypothetical protein